MEMIYLDNASTSFPKAPGLGTIMGKHIDEKGFNVGRGCYESAFEVEEKILEVRNRLTDIFGTNNPKNVVFTSSATAGLNIIINGFLNKSNSVVTTSMEHNSVVRPLWNLENQGLKWKKIECDEDGNFDIENAKKNISKNDDLVLMTHASNISGTIIPIKEIGEICKENGVRFVIDASQTVGSVELNLEEANADAIVFSGHKALLGPQGIGCMMFRENNFPSSINEMVMGGTGSAAHTEHMPSYMPDKFEAGTANIPGIIGLNHSLKFIQNEGIKNIREKKMHLTNVFLEGLLNMKNIRIVGRKDINNRCAVVSLDFLEDDNADIVYRLEKEFGILVRCGLHCASHGHKTFKTYKNGTARFSIGYFNNEKEIRAAIEAIYKISK